LKMKEEKMGFLQRFLKYSNICIQCHNNPDADAIAASFGLYRYFSGKGIKTSIVYGGPGMITKSNTLMMVEQCRIPIQYTTENPETELLLMVDCQYGRGNVQKFEAENIAMIDHHIQMVDAKEDDLIMSHYQSCSTIVYELLKEEGYPVEDDQALKTALLYGLYTDTASFSDLFASADMAMRAEIFSEDPLFEKLIKSNMSVAELLVVSDAMYNHYFDVERRFCVVEALKCDQTVLGIIGDMMIQVDAIYLSFAYTDAGAGYQISLRSCDDNLRADKIAAFICEGIGNGGGHKKKAGGHIQREKIKEKYGDKPVSEVIEMLLCQYIDGLS
ncbi:MAG: DHH family phosphoesterase, partial [Lachnospiraceae bacterium]|nr:DHH family phosphoesterase [Lachnospiraceae bacterium]